MKIELDVENNELNVNLIPNDDHIEELLSSDSFLQRVIDVAIPNQLKPVVRAWTGDGQATHVEALLANPVLVLIYSVNKDARGAFWCTTPDDKPGILGYGSPNTSVYWGKVTTDCNDFGTQYALFALVK